MITSVGDVEKVEPSYFASGNVKWHSIQQFSYKVTHELNTDPAFYPGNILKRKDKNVCLHKDRYVGVHSIIHNN